MAAAACSPQLHMYRAYMRAWSKKIVECGWIIATYECSLLQPGHAIAIAHPSAEARAPHPHVHGDTTKSYLKNATNGLSSYTQGLDIKMGH